MVDGVAAASSSGPAGAGLLYRGDPAVFLRVEQTVDGPLAAGLPDRRMGLALGRLVLAGRAHSSAEAATVHLVGWMDEVRLWSRARGPAEVLATAVLDTVPRAAAGLLGYWALNEPRQLRVCAGRLGWVFDQVTGQRADLLHGAAVVLSDAPLDQAPTLSVRLLAGALRLSPANVTSNATADAAAAAGLELADGDRLRMLVGDRLVLGAAATDSNPTDTLRLRLETPSDARNQPTGLLVTGPAATAGGGGGGAQLTVEWSPGPADAGKRVLLCFAGDGEVRNPGDAGPGARPQPPAALRRCVTAEVAACACRALAGDTLRGVARRYRVPWRTLLALNPGLPGPDDLLAGRELAIGRLYRLRGGERVEDLPALFGVGWDALATHNAPSLLRLAAPPPVVCSAAASGSEVCRPSEAAQAAAGLAGLVKAGRLVVDVNYTDVGQTARYGDGDGTDFCIVGRMHGSCL